MSESVIEEIKKRHAQVMELSRAIQDQESLGLPKTYSRANLANLLGISKSSINAMIDDGTIKVDERGRILFAESLKSIFGSNSETSEKRFWEIDSPEPKIKRPKGKMADMVQAAMSIKLSHVLSIFRSELISMTRNEPEKHKEIIDALDVAIKESKSIQD